MKSAKDVLISVVIPVYNGEKYIRTCVKQMQNQTLKTRFEIIFVNDGSTDQTLKLIQTYAGDDARIRVVSQENKGVSAARNRGIELAEGEWIVFVDVDDDIAPEYLEDVCQEIEKRATADILIYARHYVDKDSKEINTDKFTRNELICSLLTETPLEELGTDFLLFSVWSKAYRKELIKNNDISFVEGLRWGEDMVFQCRAFLCARDIQFIYKGFYRYVQNEESTMHKFRKDDTETLVRMQKEMKLALNRIWENKEVEESFYKKFLIGWFIAISGELKAWKVEESFPVAYRRLQKIQKESCFREVISKIDHKRLDWKSRIRLFFLRRLPSVYLLFVRR